MFKMANMHPYVMLALFLLISPISKGWWLFSDPQISSGKETQKEGQKSQKIANFEVLDAEDKFLAIAKEYLDLPALDRCQHKVMDELKKACNDITEEELAKLSVALLNCQSESEGRPIFECTQDMSIADCTSPMDPNTWNAYHIVSNRARSVCYATRQHQFRRRTELAVNKLAVATHQQLSTMDQLKEDQKLMQETALASLDSVRTQHEELSHQHSQLKSAHTQLRHSLLSNMDHLSKEKSIIAQSQEQLIEMTESVLVKLENATEQVSSQSEGRREQHHELMVDLGKLKDKAKQVWDKMDESIIKLSTVQDQTAAQYQKTLEDLKQINVTINYILKVINNLDYAINTQLSWLVSHVGGAASGLEVVLVLGGHAAFLVLSAFILIFIQAPSLPRVTLLVLVVGNTLSALQWQSSLDLLTMAVLLASVTAGDWGITLMKKKRPNMGMLTWRQSGSNDDRDGMDCYEKEDKLHEAFVSDTPAKHHPSSFLLNTPTKTHAPLFLSDTPTEHHPLTTKAGLLNSELQDLVDDMTTEEYTSYRSDLSANQVNSSTILQPSRTKCQAITKGGLQCKINPLKGSPYCRRHSRLS